MSNILEVQQASRNIFKILSKHMNCSSIENSNSVNLIQLLKKVVCFLWDEFGVTSEIILGCPISSCVFQGKLKIQFFKQIYF